MRRDLEAQKKIESLEENLKDKDDELEYLEDLNQALFTLERKSSDELMDARKELINVSFFSLPLKLQVLVTKSILLSYLLVQYK